MFLVQVCNCDGTMKPSRADDFNAVNVDFNLNTSYARIIPMRNCIVDCFGNHTVRYLIHIICSRTMAVFPCSMVKMSIDECNCLIRQLKQIALNKLHIDAGLAFLHARIAYTLDCRARERTLHIASEQQHASFCRHMPFSIDQMQ